MTITLQGGELDLSELNQDDLVQITLDEHAHLVTARLVGKKLVQERKVGPAFVGLQLGLLSDGSVNWDCGPELLDSTPAPMTDGKPAPIGTVSARKGEELRAFACNGRRSLQVVLGRIVEIAPL